MPINANYSLVLHEDGVVTVSMTPPTPVGGWPIEWTLRKRFGSETAIATKSVASGYNGVSGITVINSGQGIFNIAIDSVDTSGLDPGAYANGCDRLSSGRRTCLSLGYVLLGLDVGA